MCLVVILTRITCGTDTELASLQWRALLRAGLYSGEVYVASDSSVEAGKERIMSVAIWWGPGKIAMGTYVHFSVDSLHSGRALECGLRGTRDVDAIRHT